MDTIHSMHPIVKSMLDDACETDKKDELGSWKCAITVANGTWQTRDWHSKNATFTIRNYQNCALLYYHHLMMLLKKTYPSRRKGSQVALHFRGPKRRECRLLYTGRTQTPLRPMQSAKSSLMPKS